MHVVSQSEHVTAHRPRVQTAWRWPRADHVLLAFLVGLSLGMTGWGLLYYLAPVAERVRHPLHAVLRPSGLVGQSFGILGLLLFLFMWLYPLRRKFKWLSWTGALGEWMNVHAVVGIGLPLLVGVHAAWRFRGVIGLGYWSMLLVSVSGLVGRYLYVRIPRSKTGLELSRDESASQRKALVTEIAATLDIDPVSVARTLNAAIDPTPARGLAGALRRFVLDDVHRRLAVREMRRMWSAPRPGHARVDSETIARAIKLARHEIALAQQLRMLDATHRLFRYWHVAHRPVAITALLAVLVHVVVVVAMGQTWLR